MSFPPDISKRVLIDCGRSCSICHKFCGTKIELHHIIPRAKDGEDSYENCIPLCFDCHADVRAYDPTHPKGKKYTEKELKGHRDAWYAKVKQPFSNVANDNLDKKELLDSRFQLVIDDYKKRGTPKFMIDTFLDLTQNEKADLYERAIIWKKNRKPKNNPYLEAEGHEIVKTSELKEFCLSILRKFHKKGNYDSLDVSVNLIDDFRQLKDFGYLDWKSENKKNEGFVLKDFILTEEGKRIVLRQ